jgi:hypothetical protein
MRRVLVRFPCNTAKFFVRRTPPRSALSLPEKPCTCPQNLSPRTSSEDQRAAVTRRLMLVTASINAAQPAGLQADPTT